MKITLKNRNKCRDIIEKAVKHFYDSKIGSKYVVTEDFLYNYIYDYNTFEYENEGELIPFCVDISVKIINATDKILNENLYNIEIK